MKTDRIIRNITCMIAAIWLALQVLLVFEYKDLEQVGDPQVYIGLAQQMVDNGDWYPSSGYIDRIDNDSTYIRNPGYVNLLTIFLRIFGSVTSVFIANILFNVMFAFSMWILARHLASRMIADITLCLFCMCHYCILPVAMTFSELPSMAIAFSATALLTCKRYVWHLFAGLLFIVAYYMRPTVMLIGMMAFAYILFTPGCRRRILPMSVGSIVGILLLLTLNYNISGGYLFLSANTFGVNMYLGANEWANGCSNCSYDEELDRSMENKNVFECDSIYKQKAAEWIIDNKGKWFGLAFEKLRIQFIPESMISMMRKDGNPIVTGGSGVWKPVIILWLWYPLLYDIMLYTCAVAGMWFSRKRIIKNQWALLIPVAGTIFLCIMTNAGNRYNYTMLPVMMFFAACAVARILKKNRDVAPAGVS